MGYWYSRTLCDVLEEMRKLNKTRNYSYLESLIEEAQSMGSRMEAGLGDIKNLERLRDEIRDLKKQRKALKKELERLNDEKQGLSSSSPYFAIDSITPGFDLRICKSRFEDWLGLRRPCSQDLIVANSTFRILANSA